MRKILAAWGICWLTFLAFDWFWLAVAARELYRRGLVDWLASTVGLAPLMIWYAIASCVLVYFIIRPGLKKDNLGRALVQAAMLGTALYAGINLNNAALLKDWPLGLSVISVAWGIVVTMAATAITHLSLRSKRLASWI